MKKTISRLLYFIIAATLIIWGLIVKYFLVDKDFVHFNQKLLLSDIIFLHAGLLCVVGLSLYAIKKSKKSTLKDSTIITSAILILPFTFLLALNSILPFSGGDDTLSSMLAFATVIGLFMAFIWILLLIITFIRQTFIILTT